MTGLRGGTNHSAAARSNKRALHQERKCATIDASQRDEHTFEGIVRHLRHGNRVSCKNGIYTMKLHAGIFNSTLGMLEEVKAVVVKYNFETMTISFKAHKPHVWTLDPLMMLPAVTTGAEVTGAHPAVDGFKATVIGTTSTGVQIEYTTRGQLWSAPKPAQGEIPYENLEMYTFEPRCMHYELKPTMSFEEKLALKKQRDAEKRAERSAALQADRDCGAWRKEICIANFAAKKVSHNGRAVMRVERIK